MKPTTLKICMYLLSALFLLSACIKTNMVAQPVEQNPEGSPINPSELPLFSIEDLSYKGAFRLPATTFGASSLNYSQGPIAYNPSNHSLLMVGHAHQQAIAEFAIPILAKSTDLSALTMANAPIQNFLEVLERAKENAQNLDQIGGLAVVEGKLLVNAYEYYDAPGDNTQSMLSLSQADDMASANVEGFFSVQGGAGHTSGWISSIPNEWQSLIGGTHITGQSSGIPIISRTSVGPSAFAFNPSDVSSKDPIPTTTLLDFSLDNPLHEDLSNESGNNKSWTHLSQAIYGFIVPGTRTYLTLGHSGGHESGVCYKCTQDNDNLCGGYCAPKADDYASFYWLWDMNDLLAVKSGSKESFDVRPYAYGELAVPFGNAAQPLGGGAFDPVTGQLYLTVQKADRAQGEYSNPPVVIVYTLN